MLKTEDIVPLMQLQWIKGDKAGNMEVVKDVDIMGEFAWINFEGGERINGHVINEFMTLIGMVSKDDIAGHMASKEASYQEFDQTIHLSPVKSNSKVELKSTETFEFDILSKANRNAKMNLDLSINFDFISEDKITMLLELYGDNLYEALKDFIRVQVSEDVITSCIEGYLEHKFPDFIVVNKQDEDIDDHNEDTLS
tara:strand:+ start:1164 stop:1754 length:591 start_codon:yes stop_codon:yes gene_type:complete